MDIILRRCVYPENMPPVRVRDRHVARRKKGADSMVG